MNSTYSWHSDDTVVRRTIQAAVRSLRRRLCTSRPQQSPTVAVAVLTAHRHDRRTLRREIEHAVGQLRRVLPLPPSVAVRVIVQQILGTERPLAGSYQISQRPDGAPAILFRLALTTEGTWLDIDTILAVLAEAWIGYVIEQAEGPSVSAPVDLPDTLWMVRRREAMLRAAEWDARHHRRNNTGRAA